MAASFITTTDHLAALQKSHQLNGILPAKVIVYDDGVNDFQLLDGWSTVNYQHWTTCVRKYRKAMSKPLSLSWESNYRSLAVQNWRWSWWRSVEAPDSLLVILAILASYSIGRPAPSSIIPWPIRMTYSSTGWSLPEWRLRSLEWYDFYLIWQMARQGTVAPTHFNIIWDQTVLVFSSRPGDQGREKDVLFFVLDWKLITCNDWPRNCAICTTSNSFSLLPAVHWWSLFLCCINWPGTIHSIKLILFRSLHLIYHVIE